MRRSASTPRFCQVAMSVANLAASARFYNGGFGFRHAGGNYASGDGLAILQGLPREASMVCLWSVDRQDSFQLEIFQYASPPAKPLPKDWRPCDIGYVRLGLHVSDFDAALARLATLGVALLTKPFGRRGVRRVCVRDPDGIIVEVMEDDVRPPEAMPSVRPAVPVAMRSLTLSVPDLARSRRFLVDTLGLPEVSGTHLHSPEMESLWGLAGAKREEMLLAAGDVFLEVVQYLEPVGRPRPEGQLLSDQGLLNFALRFTDRRRLLRLHRKLLAAGYTSNNVPNTGPGISVAYVNDDQGFSVELLYYPKALAAPLGFEPLILTRR